MTPAEELILVEQVSAGGVVPGEPARNSLKRLLREREHRLKELTCLHAIAILSEKPAVTEEEILQEIVSMIPSAYARPEETHARFITRDMEFTSPHFKEQPVKESTSIVVFGAAAGTLDLYFPIGSAPGAGSPEFQGSNVFLQTVSEFIGRIVERKRSAMALHKAMRKLRDFKSIVNRSPAVVVLWRASQGRPVEFVSENVKQFGYTANELISGRISWSDIVHPEDRAGMEEALVDNADAGLKGFTRAYRLITRTGEVRWVEDRTVALQDIHGFLDYYQGIILDVTEQKKAEEQKRIQSTALEAAPNGIVITEPNGTIIWVNAAFTELTGYTADEVLGRKPSLLKSGRHDRSFYQQMWQTIRSGRTWTGELVNRRKDGSTFFAEQSITPVMDGPDCITHYVGVTQDISARKQARRALIGNQAKLRALAAKLSLAEEHERRRLAAVLHDQIGPLLATCDLKLAKVTRGAVSGEVQETLQAVRGLISQAIGETRSLTFELSPPILYELGMEAAVELLCEQMEKQYGVSFRFQQDGKKRSVEKEVQVLLFRAVQELLFNVVKHADAQHALVSMCGETGWIKITVEDDGMGFDPSDLGDGFGRTGGFGLFNLREQIQHAGGILEIHSTSSRGTRVVVWVPLASGADMEHVNELRTAQPTRRRHEIESTRGG